VKEIAAKPAVKKARVKAEATAAAAAPERVAASAFTPDVPETFININHAGRKVLLALPGIGPGLAGEIIQTRKKTPFQSVDDLTRVSGIGPAKLERLKALITV
jgi:competence ComEA-like helix-hairpin-helix protein